MRSKTEATYEINYVSVYWYFPLIQIITISYKKLSKYFWMKLIHVYMIICH